MTKDLAMQLLALANIYLTDEGKKLLEKVVSADGNNVEAGTKM